VASDSFSVMGIISTNNNYGWTSSLPNQVTMEFLRFLSSSPSRTVALDIGAAYGVATIAALRTGAEVIANDIDEIHLQSIVRQAEMEDQVSRLETIRGYFPGELNFEELRAIHCSNVLHFLTGTEIEEGARDMHSWLKPAGKIFIQVGTIYAGHIKKLLPTFEKRRRSGSRWAGETNHAKAFVMPEFVSATPTFMNYMDADPLVEAFESAGFVTEKAWYYTRDGAPDLVKNDGREFFGYIGIKP
jgi:SAM-dependent methyltransferase